MKYISRNKSQRIIRLPRWSSLITASCLISLCISACGPVSSVNNTPLTKAEQSLLEIQPANETRMASTAKKGYTPTSVWQIKRPGDPHVMYIGGTAHLVKDSEFPLPSAYYAAYALSDDLFVESTDIGLIAGTRIIFSLTPWMLWNADKIFCLKDQTIADYVKPKTLAALKKKYPNYDDIKDLKPAGIVLLGMGGRPGEEHGVESVFEAMAKRDKKPIGVLDSRTKIIGTAADTMKMLMEITINDIDKRGADAVIMDHLGDDNDNDSFDNIRRGNVKSLEADLMDFEKELKKELGTERGSELYNELLPERNERWVKIIDQLYQKKQKAYVIAGAAHFAGPIGLPTRLRQQGFIVTQMYGVNRP